MLRCTAFVFLFLVANAKDAPKIEIKGYDMFTRKVTIEWQSATPGLTWEVQVQRWNRHGEEVLADWITVGNVQSSTAAETMAQEVFVDLQRYLYAFRVQAVSDNGSQGVLSSTTELYGERMEETNATASAATSNLQTSESLMDAPQVMKLGSGFPLVKRENATVAVLKTLKTSLELDVTGSFPIFHSWMLEAVPLLRTAVSTYLNTTASVSITSCDLFLGSTARKYAAFDVYVIVLSEGSGVDYDHEVDMVRVALEALRGSASARLLEVYVAELGSHGVLVPDELAIVRQANSEVHMADREFAVDTTDGALTDSDGKLNCGEGCAQSYNLYLIVGAVVLLVSAVTIICLYRKYRLLSQAAHALQEKDLEKQAGEIRDFEDMKDLKKQASELRHAKEDIQHARNVIQHEKQQLEEDQLRTVASGQGPELPTLLVNAAPVSNRNEAKKVELTRLEVQQLVKNIGNELACDRV